MCFTFLLTKSFHFQFFLQDLDYEGALRFYFDDGKSELTKAVRVTNRTTTEELIPKLVEKFSLPKGEQYALYEIHEQEGKDSFITIAVMRETRTFQIFQRCLTLVTDFNFFRFSNFCPIL